jgi:DeoR/GlpR family transcriptional regulator of sugar metabolism
MIPRHSAILELLGQGKEVSVAAFARRFRVTPVTIRRDLDALREQGLVERTHGGAVLQGRGRVEFAFRRREETMAAAKRAIGAAAAELVRPGMSVSIDTGTTTLEVARALAGIDGLTVLTSSLPVAAALHPVAGIELVLLGGRTRKDHPDLFGALTEENLSRFEVDLAILGADAVDRAGLMTTDVDIARVSRAMIRHAAGRVLVADHTKFGRRALVRIAGWDDVDTVVTDKGMDGETRKWLRRAARTVFAGAAARARAGRHRPA